MTRHTPEHPAGVCRYCRCQGDACKLADGDLCAWLTPSRTVCTAPGCIVAYHAAHRAAAYAAELTTRKRTPPEIEALKQQERKERRKQREARRKARVA